VYEPPPAPENPPVNSGGGIEGQQGGSGDQGSSSSDNSGSSNTSSNENQAAPVLPTTLVSTYKPSFSTGFVTAANGVSQVLSFFEEKGDEGSVKGAPANNVPTNANSFKYWLYSLGLLPILFALLIWQRSRVLKFLENRGKFFSSLHF
ncbi:hypothetical protein HYS91_05060, partial [Candidatus Daviesbacteria bacterium]|nr:hypothetical protein [Candidatus Daviesbacteria bacterium]